MRQLFTYLIITLLCVNFSCNKEEETPFNTGITRNGKSIDYTNFTILGDGITAGYSDNVWYKDAQKYAVGALFATQLEAVGVSAGYSAPEVSKEGLGIPAEDGKVYRYSKGAWILGEARVRVEEVESIVGKRGAGTDFTDISVIGSKFRDLSNKNYSNENPYFKYFSSSDTASMIDHANMNDPTFVMLSIGRNDLFEYAKNKSTNPNLELAAASLYQSTIDDVLGSFPNTNGGVAIGIDDINNTPYFSHVRNSISLQASTANALNEGIDTLVSRVVISIFDSLRTVTYPIAKDTVKENFLLPLLVDGWEGELGVAIKGVCPITNRECDPSSDLIAERIIYNRSYNAAIERGVPVAQAIIIATAYLQTGKAKDEIDLLIYAGVKQQWVESYETDATSTIDSLMMTDPFEVLIIEENFKTSVEKLFERIGDRSRVYEAIANQLFNVVLGNVEGDLTASSLSEAIDNSISNVVILAIDALRERGYFPVFVEGENPFFCIDPNSPTKMRVLHLNDKIMLPYANVLFDLREFIKAIISDRWPTAINPDQLLGVFPHLDEVYFYETQQEVALAVNDYNIALSTIADERRYTYVSVESISTKLKTGLQVNGKTFTNEYRTGNFYSMDGYGLTSAGNALITNEAFNAVNTKYGSAFSLLDISNYSGN